MNRRCFVLGALLSVTTSFVEEVFAASSSIALETEYPNQYPGLKKFEIDNPGKYHFDKDHIQSGMYFGGGRIIQAPSGGSMINIRCGSVDLDLRGFVMGANANMSGISLFPELNKDIADRFPDKAHAMAKDNRFVRIHDGTIDMARGKKGGLGVDFTDKWHSHNQRPHGRPDVQREEFVNIEYIRNEYRFENLHISSHRTALAVEGTHTIIRDCKIESAGLAAIFSVGENLLVERCEIYLRRPEWNRWRTSAAILLRDGSHAVIRNNRIFIEDGEVEGWDVHCILIRDGARDVVVEDNTFINFKRDPVTLAEGAAVIIRNNKSEEG